MQLRTNRKGGRKIVKKELGHEVLWVGQGSARRCRGAGQGVQRGEELRPAPRDAVCWPLRLWEEGSLYLEEDLGSATRRSDPCSTHWSGVGTPQ